MGATHAFSILKNGNLDLMVIADNSSKEELHQEELNFSMGQ